MSMMPDRMVISAASWRAHVSDHQSLSSVAHSRLVKLNIAPYCASALPRGEPKGEALSRMNRQASDPALFVPAPVALPA